MNMIENEDVANAKSERRDVAEPATAPAVLVGQPGRRETQK